MLHLIWLKKQFPTWGLLWHPARMRRTLAISAVLVCCCGFWTPVASQSITANGVARSYSANYFMRTACLRYFKVNQSEASTVGEAALMFGNDRFGAEAMRPPVVIELERRRLEVEATGEAAWCSYKRSSMIVDGLAQLFR
jgi:hypothetical protein